MYNTKKGEKNNYLGFKRILAFLAALGLWAVSMYFSYKGFEFESTEVLWFGIVMALVVTVVELVFNTNISKLNPTLLFVGIICYLYGIYTNITGFYILQHGNLDEFFSGMQWLIPVFSGLVSEVLPEALFAWGIGAFDDGDLIGNVTEIFSDNKESLPQYRVGGYNQQTPPVSSNRNSGKNSRRNKNNSSKTRVSPEMQTFLRNRAETKGIGRLHEE